MIRNQIINRAAHVLEDESFVHFLPIDLEDAIQDGYDLISLRTGCLEKVATVSFGKSVV